MFILFVLYQTKFDRKDIFLKQCGFFSLYFKMNSISSNTISEQCILIQQQQQNSSITNEQLDIFFSAIDDEFT